MRAPLQHDRAACGLTSIAFLQALVADHRWSRQSATNTLSNTLSKAGVTPPRWSGPPRTPDWLLKVDWRTVEALRRRAAEALSPDLLCEIEKYYSELATARAVPVAGGGAVARESDGRGGGGEGAAESPFLTHLGQSGGSNGDAASLAGGDTQIPAGGVAPIPANGDAQPWAGDARLCTQRCEVVFDIYEDDNEAFECESDSDSSDAQTAPGQAPPGIAGSAAAAADFGAFLSTAGVGPTAARLLCRSTTLERSVSLCLTDRPAFLRTLKQLGVLKLAERQAIANAIGKGVRSGYITPEHTLCSTMASEGRPPVAVR
jgi:hypothetical protein